MVHLSLAVVVGFTVTFVYAATGTSSPLAFILSLLHGMTVTCFVVSMMRRDARSDQVGGKYTSSVLYPGLPHSAIYGITTLIVAVLMLCPLAHVLGNSELAYMLVLITVLIAGINTVLGARIDQLSTRASFTPFPGFESEANSLMAQQAGVSVVHAVAICVILLMFGRIV